MQNHVLKTTAWRGWHVRHVGVSNDEGGWMRGIVLGRPAIRLGAGWVVKTTPGVRPFASVKNIETSKAGRFVVYQFSVLRLRLAVWLKCD